MRSSKAVVNRESGVGSPSVDSLSLFDNDQLAREALERAHRREILDRLLGDLQQIER
jgi:hypothetical protein